MARSGRASTMPFIYDDLSAPLKPGVRPMPTASRRQPAPAVCYWERYCGWTLRLGPNQDSPDPEGLASMLESAVLYSLIC